MNKTERDSKVTDLRERAEALGRMLTALRAVSCIDPDDLEIVCEEDATTEALSHGIVVTHAAAERAIALATAKADAMSAELRRLEAMRFDDAGALVRDSEAAQ